MSKQKELATRTQIESTENDLLHAIARDVGEEIVDYVRRMYPEAIESTSSTFCLSLRNSIHNQIVSVVRERKYVGDFENGTLRPAENPKEWLAWRRFRRKRLRALWRKGNQAKAAHER